MKKIFLYLTLLLLIFNPLTFANNEEKIISFESNIVVNKNGSLDIEENIKVTVKNNIFNHGLTREFKTNRQHGNLNNQQYIVKSVKINNEEASFFTDSNQNKFKIYIGDKNTTLTPGDYTFSLKYTAFNSEGYFKDHDEIFFNINGPDTPVITEKIFGYIKLPEDYNSQNIKLNGFQGSSGSKNKFNNFKINKNQIFFESTSILKPYENISIAVWFEKGFFEGAEDVFFVKYENYVNYLVVIILNAAAIYIVIFVFKRDKTSEILKNPTVTYDIPKEISPSLFSYLYYFQIDNKALVSELINLAVKKVIKIEKIESNKLISKKNDFKITLINKDATNNFFEESLIYNLFPSGSETLETSKMEDKGHLAKAQYRINQYVNDEKLFSFDKNGFMGFRIWYPIILYFLLAIFAILIGQSFSELSGTAAFSSFFLLFSSFFYRPIIVNYKIKRNFWSGLILISFLLILIGIFYWLPMQTYKYFILSSFLIFFFYELLNSFDYLTKKGIGYMAILLGFRKFALSVKEYNYGVLKEIPLSLNMYEKYLPYALALGIDTQWSKKFGDVLNTITDEGFKRENYYLFYTSTFDLAIRDSVNEFSNSEMGSSLGYGSSDGGFSSSSSSGGGGGSSGTGGW